MEFLHYWFGYTYIDLFYLLSHSFVNSYNIIAGYYETNSTYKKIKYKKLALF
jgi:hypothetical protein